MLKKNKTLTFHFTISRLYETIFHSVFTKLLINRLHNVILLRPFQTCGIALWGPEKCSYNHHNSGIPSRSFIFTRPPNPLGYRQSTVCTVAPESQNRQRFLRFGVLSEVIPVKCNF